MNETPRKTTVTLEDLLRVKRAEQPPAEFWAEFERGLRTKQLAAIVEPRPWWAPLIRISSRVSRYQLPVGVTAILAITLLTVREYGPVASNPVFEPTSSETASVPVSTPASNVAMRLKWPPPRVSRVRRFPRLPLNRPRLPPRRSPATSPPPPRPPRWAPFPTWPWSMPKNWT